MLEVATDHPLISVLMPVFNAERYLRASIDSILSQTLQNFEIILVNDGSSDQSVDIISRYVDPRIRVVHNQKNMGVAQSLNRGIEVAQGLYIARMDADDISQPNRFKYQVEYLVKHSEIGVLGSQVQYIDENDQPLPTGQYPLIDAQIRWRMLFTNPFAHPTVMIRQDALQAVGGYQVITAEDHDLWARLSASTQFANLSEKLLQLRRYPGSVTKQSRQALLRSSAMVSQALMVKHYQVDAPLKLVEILYQQPIQTSQDVLSAARLIISLFRSFEASPTLTTSERRWLRTDAARLVIKCAARENLSAATRMKILGAAFALDPLAGWNIIANRIRPTRHNLVL